jgi:hypothetical protein
MSGHDLRSILSKSMHSWLNIAAMVTLDTPNAESHLQCSECKGTDPISAGIFARVKPEV